MRIAHKEIVYAIYDEKFFCTKLKLLLLFKKSCVIKLESYC